MKEETWETFSQSGMLWFINRVLAAFGWLIIVELDLSGNILRTYPARTTALPTNPPADLEARETFMKNVGPMRVPMLVDTTNMSLEEQQRIARVQSYTVDPE